MLAQKFELVLQYYLLQKLLLIFYKFTKEPRKNYIKKRERESFVKTFSVVFENYIASVHWMVVWVNNRIRININHRFVKLVSNQICSTFSVRFKVVGTVCVKFACISLTAIQPFGVCVAKILRQTISCKSRKIVEGVQMAKRRMKTQKEKWKRFNSLKWSWMNPRRCWSEYQAI